MALESRFDSEIINSQQTTMSSATAFAVNYPDLLTHGSSPFFP
ncbi:hypothetical protein [Haloquadratum walsbyi]|nr:hypothetical protein [Haloquadratum walsbyi]